MKKGQITVFMIIGIALLFIVGAALYITSSSEKQRLELAKPRVSEIPERAQPVRDVVEQCITRISKDGLRRIGESGGYVDWSTLRANPFAPTEGDAVQMAPYTDPPVAYWWYMKSKNNCLSDCEFGTKRPPLLKSQGSRSIEGQLDDYISEKLPDCVTLGEYQGCTIRANGKPSADTRIAERSVGFLVEYPLQISCEDQTYTVNDYYTELDINLLDIYEIATNITNYESNDGVLEQATTTIISTFGGVDEDKLPPFRDLEIGGPSPGTYWIKFEVLNKLKELITAYTPAIQAYGARNYAYVKAPEGTRDPQLYELIYDRQFLIPLNKTYPDVDVQFSYLDWWEPYFDLNCNGQLCRADTGTNFYILPFSINRYEFAYDLSYPVMVEIRNPYALNGEGYSFRIMLEQNMRNSARFKTDSDLLTVPAIETAPSLFCNPEQRTSGNVKLNVKDGETLRASEGAFVTYLCGTESCNMGVVRNGTYLSRFPSCIGGTLLISKPDHVNYARALDTNTQQTQDLAITLEPIRTLKATVKDYLITKDGKKDPWEYESASGLVRPPATQETLIMLNRKSLPGDDPFFAYTNLKGGAPGDITLAPGKYTISITSLLREKIVIPPDNRCFTMKKFASTNKECYQVPQKPIHFNVSQPFPTGMIEYEYEFRSEDLRGAKSIEFRQFALGIHKVEEKDRVVEDLSEMQKGQLYADNNPILVWPVISK